MTGMMLYFALGLMVLTVLSNRYWRRQLTLTRIAMSKLKERVDDVTREVADIATDYAQLAQHQADMEKRVQKAEIDMQAAILELDQKKGAPMQRYFVFDRNEPRPGRFWEVAVRFQPMAVSFADQRGYRGWTGIRRVLLVADGERDARERVAARYPRKAGFEIVEVAGCRLNGLTVNRISELSTFRKPGKPEEEAAAAAARPQRRTSPAQS
ncbi:hypothetical protein A6A40_13600 [Azospirillum humicireducens]|uniref:Uncharacterized protein n=1 Tax=Azospirillum humicireducens TaxID=1226968 RepID=A0A160JI88_9PROT|nr:hypothetical protein [Azospirillum humicireducens]ANC92825.1 hypothetical protein A6A40_13600 [Azospirillum humicireducens]